MEVIKFDNIKTKLQLTENGKQRSGKNCRRTRSSYMPKTVRHWTEVSIPYLKVKDNQKN